MLQQIEVEIRKIVDGTEGLRLFRASKARVDWRQHAHATRKLIEHRRGRLNADFGMQEQQRLAMSAFNQLDADVVNNDGGRWIGGHRLYSAVVMRRQTAVPILHLRDQPAFCPTKSVSSLRVVSGANQMKSGANSRNEHASSGSPAATEWAVAVQPMIIGASEATPRPKVKDAPTPVPRIWVGNSSAV